MPYYFAFENLPPEKPAGPLHGEYVAASEKVQLTSAEEPKPSGGALSWLRGLFSRKAFAGLSDSDRTVIVAVAQVLRDKGFLNVDCTYDGGNDEGFAHLDSARTADATCPAEEIVQRLRGSQLADPAFDAWGVQTQVGAERWKEMIVDRSKQNEDNRIRDSLDSFVQAIATVLLGEGFGTGEYAMAGRFRFDLHTGELLDLPLDPPPDFIHSDAFSLDDYYPEDEQN